MATPLQRYREDCAADGFVRDPMQEAAVLLLDELYDRLLARAAAESVAGRLWRRLARRKPDPVQGLYLWGGVGRGKTYLMDTFFECLPPQGKLRVHFHRFMQHVHRELTALAGEKNPLESVAETIAGDSQVLCFDEFFVSDIADAMLLGNLMQALFSRGVTLVATSNIPPSELYLNGLQRQRFLPVIDLIEEHTKVVNVDGGTDYRLRTLTQAALFHHPLDEAAASSLQESFNRLAPHPGRHWERIKINGRYLTCRCLADDVAWFEFEELCVGPRSQNDYIELARIFHAVVLSGVKQMDGDSEDTARRFINLVDEFYDRRVKIVISAQCPVVELYAGGRLDFEFQRTTSRLLEMQSHEYLALQHLP